MYARCLLPSILKQALRVDAQGPKRGLHACLFAASLMAGVSCAHPDGAPLIVHGVQRTCRDVVKLDEAIFNQDEAFFAGWSDADYAQAKRWVAACPNDGRQFVDAASREFALTVRLNRILAAKASAAYDAKARREEGERRKAQVAEVAANRPNVTVPVVESQPNRPAANDEPLLSPRPLVIAQDCTKRPSVQLFNAQEDVIRLREELDEYVKMQRYERKVSQESGVRNLRNEYEIGSKIVELRESIDETFREYRKLGGKAPSSQAVRHTIKDFCPY